MIVTLIGKSVLYKIKLPNLATGNYWVTGENDKKLVNIEGDGEKWTIFSNNNTKIIKSKKQISSNFSKIAQVKENIISATILRDYSMYYIYLKDFPNDIFILYCTPNYEENFAHLNIKNSQEILIGSSKECHIEYTNPLVKQVHARIFFSNGKLMLENYDTDFGTFVNNQPVNQKQKLLFNGDVIFIMGLKIIIIGRSIFINNPYKRVQYSNDVFEINCNDGKKRYIPNIKDVVKKIDIENKKVTIHVIEGLLDDEI